MARFLLIDFETRSTVDLRKAGVFRYAEDPTTEILCASYAFDDGAINRWRMGSPCPDTIRRHVLDGGKVRAWNAQFEETMWAGVLERQGWPVVAPEQWVCSAALAARAALPRSLEQCAQALGLPVQKDAEGHRLMLQMCKPRRIGPDGSVTWWEDEGRMERLMQYCDMDVTVEREIFEHLPPVGSAFERRVWLLDQTINGRGVRLDRAFVAGATAITDTATKNLNAQMKAATNGAAATCTQTAKIMQYLKGRGLDVSIEDGDEIKDSIAKDQIRDLLKLDLPADVRRVLELRSEGSKASTAKLRTMNACVCSDDRARGLLLYFGASTGRWSGKLIQPQNFPRGTVKDVARFALAIASGDFATAERAAEEAGVSVMELVASSLRGAFIPAPGYDFLAADFNAIEARVLAWLAGAPKLLAAFRQPKPPVYTEMGAAIFGKTVAEVQAGHDTGAWPLGRWLGKTTILGAGYQMGWRKFQASAKKLGDVDLDEDTARRAVEMYRATHYQIPEVWQSMNLTALDVVENGVEEWTDVAATGGKVKFCIDSGYLRMGLPSGRSLWYAQPRLRNRDLPWSTPEKPASALAVIFNGVNSLTRRWGPQALYGGLLTENAVQAIARDLMAEAMLRLEAAGYPIVLTVHDEVLSEVPEGFGSVAAFEQLMAEVPAWAEGCPIAAEGWRGERYRK